MLCLISNFNFLVLDVWQIPIALDMAKDFKEKEDADLFRKIKNDEYMLSAVVECYETLREIIYGLLEDETDRK